MVKIVKKNHGNERLNNLNDPSRPQCVNVSSKICFSSVS